MEEDVLYSKIDNVNDTESWNLYISQLADEFSNFLLWNDNNTITNISIDSSSSLPTSQIAQGDKELNNYWALLALVLVFGTAAGNILVCLAITWDRRLQNVTNYFLMSLAFTDLFLSILVMPLGIVTLVKGYFPLGSEHCLTWICLDVLFCTASIMHLCTISVDRYLSLRYPMRFGRNKTRRRVILKIVFVWLLSIAMSLPLSLMYSKDHASVLVNGTCQIPDPVYKLVGSIVCFYIPLCVMLLTYCLTVRLLAEQRQNIGGINQSSTPWASGWLGQTPALERRCTWRRLLKSGHNVTTLVTHAHSGNSTDTELSTLDNHELWLPESSIPEPTPNTMTALHQFGAEMLKLSRGLESAASSSTTGSPTKSDLSSSNHLHFSGSPQRYLHPPPTNSFYNKYVSPTQLQQEQFHQTTATTQQSHNLQSKDMKIVGVEKLPAKSLMRSSSNFKRSERATRKRSLSSPTSPTISQCLLACKKRRGSSAIDYKWHNHNNKVPDTPSPKCRNRFNSLPMNALICLSRQPSFETQNSCSTSPILPLKGANSDTEVESSRMSKSQYCITKQHDQSNIYSNSDYLHIPAVCTCPYFGDRPLKNCVKPAEVKIVSSVSEITMETPSEQNLQLNAPEPKKVITPIAKRKLSVSKTASVVTWDAGRYRRRGSSFGGARTSLLLTPSKTTAVSYCPSTPLRRSATLRSHKSMSNYQHQTAATTAGNLTEVSAVSCLKIKSKSAQSSPCLLQRNQTVRSHHSRNSSVISRNSSRHGRIIRLEQKATKVLGVVFFTFVILWSPFFVLNLLPTVCAKCEESIAHWVFDVVTWLGYASSMVNPIFYTIFNNVFRQAFKKVLLCRYSNSSRWRASR